MFQYEIPCTLKSLIIMLHILFWGVFFIPTWPYLRLHVYLFSVKSTYMFFNNITYFRECTKKLIKIRVQKSFIFALNSTFLEKWGKSSSFKSLCLIGEKLHASAASIFPKFCPTHDILTFEIQSWLLDEFLQNRSLCSTTYFKKE